MNHKMIFTALFILFSIPAYATDPIQDQATVNRLINKIKQSSPEHKRELMNQLKLTLRKMNKETRKKAMLELQKSFATQTSIQTVQTMPQPSVNSASGMQVIPKSIPSSSIITNQTRPAIPQNGQQKGMR